MADLLTRAGSFVGIILLGFLLRKIGFFRREDFYLLSKITLRITLPAAIITSFAGKQVDPAMLLITLMGFGCGAVYIGFAFLKNAKKPKENCAFDILNFSGYNIGAFTMPFVQNFLGPTGVIVTILFDTGNAVICLGGAYGIADIVRGGNGFSLKHLLLALGRSVPFLCYMFVVLLNLTGLSLPGPVLSLAQVIGNANSFMAMLMLGVGFQISGDRSQIGTIIRHLLLRFGIAGIFALGFYYLLPYSLEIRQALVILVFSPIASAVPAFTAQIKGDAGLSSAINSISILCSITIMLLLLSFML